MVRSRPSAMLTLGDDRRIRDQTRDLEWMREQCALRLARRLQDPHVRAQTAEQASQPSDYCADSPQPRSLGRSESCGALQQRHPVIPVLPLKAALSPETPLQQEASSNSSVSVQHRRGGRPKLPTRSTTPSFATATRSRSSPTVQTSSSSTAKAPGQLSRSSSSTSVGRSLPWARSSRDSSSARAASVGRGSSGSSSANAGPPRYPSSVRKASPQRERLDLPRKRPPAAPGGGLMAPTASSLARRTASPGCEAAAQVDHLKIRAASPERLSRARSPSPMVAKAGLGGRRPEDLGRAFALSKQSPACDQARHGEQQSTPCQTPPTQSSARRGGPSSSAEGGPEQKLGRPISIPDTLQEAAVALRRIIPGAGASGSRSQPSLLPFQPPSRTSSSVVTIAAPRPLKVGGIPIFSNAESHEDRAGSAAPDVHRLMEENASLRAAFDDAKQRLLRLEDEKWRLPAASTLSPQRGTPTSEQEKRTSELAGENDELRKQLAQAGQVGQKLEEQQQAAEDRMHQLEQEQALLTQQLARCSAEQLKLNGGSAVAAGCTGGSGIAPAELDVQRQLEGLSRVLGAELQEHLPAMDVKPTLPATQSRCGDPLGSRREASKDSCSFVAPSPDESDFGAHDDCEGCDGAEEEESENYHGDDGVADQEEQAEFLCPIDIEESF